ncbi:hypothetical protein [Halocatena marina]|uniref:hypothetical protein n=1 Tax=Halocatena marina TaxID=2934937 RepID=UPI00200C4894|nr:hypothetical protein [Halocatena marina]
MESSTIESSENQADDQTRWGEVISRKRTMRALLGVEGISFVLAAIIHAGMLVQGYAHREAMIAESVIGAVLLVGVTITWIRPHVTFSIAVVVQGFALLVSLIGAWTIIVGVGPRTVPDIVYHGIIIVVLIVGLGVAWRARGTESE